MADLQPYTSLSADVNKAKITSEEESPKELALELQLSMTDDQLLEKAKAWKAAWDTYYPLIQAQQEKNRRYWKGEHFTTAEMETGHAMVDNLIFEALETFIPQANKKNPDPTVYGPQEAQLVAKSVQDYLASEADRERLMLRLQRVTRYWAIYLIGVGKMSWDARANDSRIDIIKDVMLDPDGYVNDDMEFTGEWSAHKMKNKVSELIEKFPKKKAYFDIKYAGKTGTKCKYIEWWTDDFVFWTNAEMTEVFDKAKNPHWNYDLEETTTTTHIDDFGKSVTEDVVSKISGANHFEYKKKPFIFLSVFNLGDQPHDETSLIGQNIANQDLINKRNKQIDKNIDKMNAGLVISGENSGLSKEEAALASKAIDRGGAIFIPAGTPNDAIARINGQSLPSDVFAQRNDMRDELRNIFGVRGSSPSGTINEQTATGKAIVREQDTDRTGGGISKYLEQFADQYFNWKVQMMYVYYDEMHSASIIGDERTQKIVEVMNTDVQPYKLSVSVKPGSLIPKDEVSESQTASELSIAGLLDPITLYDKLGFANPRETAKKLWMWKNAPDKLFADDPEIQAIIAEQAQAAQLAAANAGGLPPVTK